MGGRTAGVGTEYYKSGFAPFESARLRCRPVVRYLSAKTNLLALSSLDRGFDWIGYSG